jgi:predicted ATPase
MSAGLDQPWDMRSAGSVGTAARFAGRQAEVSALRAAMVEATGQRCVLVRGDAGIGIGKTRLVTDVSRAAVDDGALVVTGACMPLVAGWQFLPVADALRGLTSAVKRPVLDRALALVADFVPA